jgi:hypothetical protein
MPTHAHTRTLPKHTCPRCKFEADAVTILDPPRPGDISICTNCGAINLFGDKLGVRAPDDGEKLKIVCSRARYLSYNLETDDDSELPHAKPGEMVQVEAGT